MDINSLLWFTLESAVDEVYWVDTAGTVQFANSTAVRNLGWPRNELIGMDIADFQTKMPEENSLPLNHSLVDPEGEEVFEAVHQRRDKSRYPVSVHRREFPGTGDLKYLVFARDTTHRHEHARRLKESEDEKTMILNAIHEKLLLFDRDLRIVWASNDPEESSCFSPGDLSECVCYEHLYGRAAPCKECVVQRVIEEGVRCTNEIQLPDGRFVEMSAYPVFDEKGDVINVVESRLDISKRKNVEILYQTLFSTMQSGFIILEHCPATETQAEDLVFIEVNPAFEQVSGWCAAELIGKRFRSVYPEGREEVIGRYAAVARTGEGAVFTDYNPNFNRHFHIHASPMKNGRVAAIYTDTTEIVSLSEQKKQSLIQIERNFEQLAILNDEIRNPLQVIIGLSLLSPAEESEKILKQAYVIDKLVNELDQRWLESEKIRDFLRKHYEYD